MKKIGLLFATLVMLMLFAISANALESTGQCGNEVYWNYDSSTGELVINGTGPMYDYTYGISPFYSTDIKSVIIEDGVTSIGNHTFFDCSNLESIKISDSVTSIGVASLAFCTHLPNITIPDSVTTIGNSAFSSCRSFTSITIPDSVISIGNSIFSACFSLKSVTLSNSVSCISEEAFYECNSLTSITIPDGIKSIDLRAFYNCYNLTSITLPDSVMSIGHYVFYECNSLTDVYYKGTDKHWSEIKIGNRNESLTSATIHFNYHFHSYEAIVTSPTCKTLGFTTYTCDCGDIYVNDYTDKLDHKYTSEITTPATHLSEGVRTYTCGTCGDSYTEAIAKTKEHSYNTVSKIVAPTCEKEGYTVYVCECGQSDNRNKTSATGHKYNAQSACVTCGKKCSCNCHKSGFMGFIWKIILFFNKLFKTNKTCACGVNHY